MGVFKMKIKLNREIELNNDYDVIIVGGGPSGTTAAISSAREGAKTLLIEATGMLGGMGTAGMVPAWCPFSDGEKIIYKGLAQKIFEMTKSKMSVINQSDMDWVPIDVEALKSVYDELVVESNTDILFHTYVSAVEMDGEDIDYIIAANKSGVTAYKAKVYIDCTGDGDIAAFAGAAFHYGDETGTVQPATHCFILSNVNELNYKNGELLHSHNKDSKIYDILSSGKYPLIRDAHICNSLVGKGTVGFNAGHIWDVNPNDIKNISKAMIHGRKLANQIKEALSVYLPQTFGDAHLVSTAPLMGIRETKRIIGDYELTLEDYSARKSFDDEIGRNCYYIDIHFSVEESQLNREGKLHSEERYVPYAKGESHGIPYRIMLPKRIGNLLVAGRCVSCDHVTQASLRVMPPCLVMGEAAGMAAGMAATQNKTPRGIDVQELRAKLKEAGAFLY